MKQCAVTGCTSKSDSRGFCPCHYARWRRHGDPTYVSARGPKKIPSRPHLLGFHTVIWDPAVWGDVQREEVEPHPHEAHLRAGIAQFRAMLAEQEALTVKRFP
jgi:hypothetical protein